MLTVTWYGKEADKGYISGNIPYQCVELIAKYYKPKEVLSMDVNIHRETSYNIVLEPISGDRLITVYINEGGIYEITVSLFTSDIILRYRLKNLKVNLKTLYNVDRTMLYKISNRMV